jgi:hypothetical protein
MQLAVARRAQHARCPCLECVLYASLRDADAAAEADESLADNIYGVSGSYRELQQRGRLLLCKGGAPHRPRLDYPSFTTTSPHNLQFYFVYMN